MALYSSAVEYGLHCLLYLADREGTVKLSSLDLAEMQGISPTYVAKLFARFRAAGLVVAVEGVQGGYRLARAAEAITVLQVVEALEGPKPLFQCREIRRQCAVFSDQPPGWATQGICSIHSVMQEAEARMKSVLDNHTLASLATRVANKAPAEFFIDVNAWFEQRKAGKGRRRALSDNKEQQQ